jgi:hypothetical protein
VNLPHRLHWSWILGLSLLMGFGERPAQAGPSKRYLGQPVTAPEAPDSLTEGTLQGAARGLAARRWPGETERDRVATVTMPSSPDPTSSAADPASSPDLPAPADSARAGQAGRYTGGIVLGLLAASLALFGLLGLRNHRRRSLANSLVRYAITHGRADLGAN